MATCPFTHSSVRVLGPGPGIGPPPQPHPCPRRGLSFCLCPSPSPATCCQSGRRRGWGEGAGSGDQFLWSVKWARDCRRGSHFPTWPLKHCDPIHWEYDPSSRKDPNVRSVSEDRSAVPGNLLGMEFWSRGLRMTRGWSPKAQKHPCTPPGSWPESGDGQGRCGVRKESGGDHPGNQGWVG